MNMKKIILALSISLIFVAITMLVYKNSNVQKLSSENKIYSNSDYNTTYSETDLTKAFFENDDRTKAIILNDRNVISVEISSQVANFIEENKEEITFDGQVIKLKVDGTLVNVGYDIKQLKVLCAKTGKSYDINTSSIANRINKDTNLIWVINDDLHVKAYMLMPDATPNNPIAVNIEE